MKGLHMTGRIDRFSSGMSQLYYVGLSRWLVRSGELFKVAEFAHHLTG